MFPTPCPAFPPARRCEPRVRIRAARPELHPDSPAFRAAVVLLAGPEHRFNIDRIASRCGLPRAAAAACVRRLIDNGVWAGGRAHCAWTDAADPRFWSDAAVAEGRLLRRTRGDGVVEWAPPGQWEKAYDFVGPQSDPGGAVLYLDAAPEPEDAPLPVRAAAEPEPVPVLRRAAPVFLGITAVAAESGVLLGAGAASGLPDLFPGADWLG